MALEEFQQVVALYNSAANPRLRDLAAESHAFIGWIYQEISNMSSAADEYQIAAELLAGFPDRQAIYQQRADNLRLQALDQTELLGDLGDFWLAP